jgi:cytochrome b subunit of formate dehydrogenase
MPRLRLTRHRSHPIALVLAVVFVPAMIAMRPALAAPTNDDCLGCHAEGVPGADGRTLAVLPAAFAASVHGSLECVDCHDDATEIPHADALKKVDLDTCAACHDDAVEAYREGIHARGRDGQPVATCASCHGDIHAVLPHTDPTSAAHWTHLAETCARCHANREVIAKFGIPVVQPVEAYLDGVHGRAVRAGKRAAVCSDCHGAHTILPSSDPRSTVWRTTVPDTCGKCHAAVAQQYRESVHGVAAARGVREAPVCTDCHGEHRILAPGDRNSPVSATNIPKQTCERCHGDARLAAKYGLLAESVPSFRDSFHGLALRGGQTDVANCASCHGVHGIFPASDPRSLVNPKNLPATCGKCHPGAGGRFAIGPVHVDAKTSSTRLEYWIRLIYLWLIGVVVGFMAVHVGIDLVVKARHWPPPPLPPPAHPRPTERMSRALRWQHGLVMLSFPILVYSGFALTYPESWWAAPLLAGEGRFGLRGIIHRAAALVLLTALGWHVVYLCVSAEVRAQVRRLLPGFSDVRFFAARLRHYAGRSAPPRSGACTYVEKLEYWAFIWGMVIMTVTGLWLWSSDLTLRFFPKWLSDVATTIHFYEAVLATLAIAVWHLYWVVFDPEVYPMDWSWWDGQAPPSREHERSGVPDEDAPQPPSAPPADPPSEDGDA